MTASSPLTRRVMATRPPPRRARVFFAVAAGVGLHLGVAALAAERGPSLERWAADLSVRVHHELLRAHAVEGLAEVTQGPLPRDTPTPAAPEPPSPAEPPPVQPRAEPRPRAETAPARAPGPKPSLRETAAESAAEAPTPTADRSAAAAPPEVVTAPDAQPVDLSDFVVLEGEGRGPVRGLVRTGGQGDGAGSGRGTGTSSEGAGLENQRGKATSPESRQRPRADDRSAKARPVARDWRCPWPTEAEWLELDDETVLVRVTIDQAGQVRSAELVQDPGHGFGPAAVTCVKRNRFEAARDAAGRPKGEAVVLRVRFER